MKPLFLICALLSLGTAMASDLDFTLVNETSRSFEGIYISAASNKDWDNNLLPEGKSLEASGRLQVKFNAKEKATTWDLNLVDVDGVARFCLGRFWRTATPAQQAEYLQLFRLVLVNSVAGRLGEYQGQPARINVGRPDTRPEGIIVPTTVERPNNKPVNVAWLVTTDSGAPRIADVVAEGMSLRLSQRSDYTSFLTRNNNDIDALIRALEEQVGRGAGLR